MNHFNVKPEDLPSKKCFIEEPADIARHTFLDTCPIHFDPTCNDPIFNPNHEFEFRCRYPMMANMVLSINSTSFLELMKLRDPFGRDWCMIVMFYSESCPFSARLAPYFNQIAGKFENLLTVAVDASDFTKSYRLNFRYGISGTPTVLLWVNGIGVARMANNNLNLESIKNVIITHTDLVEKTSDEAKKECVPEKFFSVGAELKNVSVVLKEDVLYNALYTLGCFLICVATFIYHVRERILLSAPVLQWFQSKCGGPLCDDIYFLFYVVPPRHQRPPPPAPAPEAADPPAAVPDENVVELPPLVVEDQ
ncbi:unnamed protein product [Caenorhabditis sp. 36 PRJEB53466]|nr:unnamed protein product [Caenorhabditis sp. 36 PRJEB53466]